MATNQNAFVHAGRVLAAPRQVKKPIQRFGVQAPLDTPGIADGQVNIQESAMFAVAIAGQASLSGLHSPILQASLCPR